MGHNEGFTEGIQVRSRKDGTKEEGIERRWADTWTICRRPRFYLLNKRTREEMRKPLRFLTQVPGSRDVLGTDLGSVRVGLDRRCWEGNSCGFVNVRLRCLCR